MQSFSASVYAKRAVAQLKSQSNRRAEQQGKTYFKSHEKIHLLGVPTPKIRELERNMFRDVAGSWSVEEGVVFCDILIRNRFL